MTMHEDWEKCVSISSDIEKKIENFPKFPIFFENHEMAGILEISVLN